MQHGRALAYGYRGDEAVHQLSDCFALPPTATIESGGIVVVRRLRREGGCPCQKAAKVQQVRLVPRSGEHLHADDITDGNLICKDFVDESADWRARISQELYPGGGVDKDHSERAARIVLRSPSQPAPRSARASSREAGSAAIVRRAKLTASRLVTNRYRRITSVHAFSSMSMLVRAIHLRYTTAMAHGKVIRGSTGSLEATDFITRRPRAISVKTAPPIGPMLKASGSLGLERCPPGLYHQHPSATDDGRTPSSRRAHSPAETRSKLPHTSQLARHPARSASALTAASCSRVRCTLQTLYVLLMPTGCAEGCRINRHLRARRASARAGPSDGEPGTNVRPPPPRVARAHPMQMTASIFLVHSDSHPRRAYSAGLGQDPASWTWSRISALEAPVGHPRSPARPPVYGSGGSPQHARRCTYRPSPPMH